MVCNYVSNDKRESENTVPSTPQTDCNWNGRIFGETTRTFNSVILHITKLSFVCEVCKSWSISVYENLQSVTEMLIKIGLSRS